MEEVDYEDEPQRFQSLVIDKNDADEIRSSELYSFHISIESFQITEEGFRKHVTYKIIGEENNSKIEIARRYKEFRILHRILSQIWPGCVIPKLPPKKAVPDLQQKSDLKDQLKDFQEIHGILGKVKKLAKMSSISFARYEESITSLMEGIKLITPSFLINKDMNITPKDNYVNPYLNIREWLRADMLDIESMTEAINKYLTLEEDVATIEMKIEKKKKGIEEMQGGKKSLSQRLSSKTQESRVLEEEKKIEDYEANKEALQKIISVCVGKLLQSDISKFKQQKIYKICITMRNYSKTTVQEYQDIAEQILQIENNLN